MRASPRRNHPPRNNAGSRAVPGWTVRLLRLDLDNVFSLNPAFVEIETSDPRSLLERARAGETEAFGELCRLYETRLLRQAVALCDNAALAEDLAQDTLVEAWKCLRRYNGRCQFFTWLCAILLNRYRNTVREKRPLPFSAFAQHDRTEFQDRIDQLADHDSRPDQAARLGGKEHRPRWMRRSMAPTPPVPPATLGRAQRHITPQLSRPPWRQSPPRS